MWNTKIQRHLLWLLSLFYSWPDTSAVIHLKFWGWSYIIIKKVESLNFIIYTISSADINDIRFNYFNNIIKCLQPPFYLLVHMEGIEVKLFGIYCSNSKPINNITFIFFTCSIEKFLYSEILGWVNKVMTV